MNQLVILAWCWVAYGAASSVHNQRLVSIPRITNNDAAEPGEVPYQVSLQINGQHICGGSLIGRKHVLTAAHCVHSIILNPAAKALLKVAVGTNQVPGSGEIHAVDRVAHSTAYIESEFLADVAVLRLKEPVKESANVKIIALPDASLQLTEGQKFYVSGFGASRLYGPGSPILKKIEMTAVSHVGCQQRWPTMPLNAGIFCAKTATGDGVCQGDSGGPVTINQQTVVGIVSAVSSQGCGIGIPDLFTRVSTYIKFIRNEMENTD